MHLKVYKGEKCRLINAHDNHRLLKEDDPMIEFERRLGEREQATDTVVLFRQLNREDKHQKAMAGGITTTLIVSHKLPNASVLAVRTGRIKIIRDEDTKRSDHVHLNGNQESGYQPW